MYFNSEFQKQVVLIDDIHLQEWENDFFNMMSSQFFYDPWKQQYVQVKEINFITTCNSFNSKSNCHIPLRVESRHIENIYSQVIHKLMLPQGLETENDIGLQMVQALSKIYSVAQFQVLPYSTMIVLMGKEIVFSDPQIFLEYFVD